MIHFLKIIFTFYLLILYSPLFAINEKIEDIFLDIKSDYTYKHELQVLYDNGMISPDENNKFNPNKLLTRDEFVWVVMEVWCKKCIKPNTALEYIQKYTGKNIFFDLDQNNKNFYCIAEAKEIEVVKWYGNSYICEDGTTKSWYSPFCTNNNITLEEALAVLMRNSSVFTIQDNNIIINQISAGTITADLSKDVKVKNTDGNVYTFYGYFKKALELSYSEYDIYGNLKKYALVSIDSKGNLNPKKYISKEEFLKMSYIVAKMNSCSLTHNTVDTINLAIGWRIDILDKTCKVSDGNCKKSNLDDQKWIYDFSSDVKTTCIKGIKDYTWVFYNKNTKEMYTKAWLYLDNYQFKSYGIWQVKLIVNDNCWNTLQLYNEISYWDKTKVKPWDNNLWIVIIADPIFWNGPLKVNFDTIVKNCNNCKYDWNFWDGNKSNLKNPNNIFMYNWVYETIVTITDENGNKISANVIIKVNDNYNNLKKQLDKINTDLKNKDSTAWKIDILDKTCVAGSVNCKKSDLKDKDGIYDFSWDIKTTCDTWIKDYTWVFYNTTTKESYEEKGQYKDNYKLKSFWIWKITLKVNDNCGNSIQSYSEVSYWDETKIKPWDNNLWVVITADPIMWNWPLKVDFDSIIKNCDNCKYKWDFWDGKTATTKDPAHIFDVLWNYEVMVTITDKYGNIASSKIVIKVTKKNTNGNNSDIVSKIDELKKMIDDKSPIDKINKKIQEINTDLKNKDSTAWKIDILDKTCVAGSVNCKKSDLKDKDGIYDFSWDIKTTCDTWIKDYTWVFYNTTTKESYEEKGQYKDNYKLKSFWIWKITLKVNDNCGNSIQSYSEVSYWDETKIKPWDNNLWVVITADPIMWNWPLKVDFDSIIKNCDNCKYKWDFWDGKTATTKDPAHIFDVLWNYEVMVTITDKYGNIASSKIVIKVNTDINPIDTTPWIIDPTKIDSDDDGVPDSEDKCILNPGDPQNEGCPIIDNPCTPNMEVNTCKSWYECNNSTWLCEVKKVDPELLWSCIYPSNGSSIFGNVMCDTCPCDYTISFLSTIRKCDIILPAIVSPDKKEIYWKGNPYQIPYSQ